MEKLLISIVVFCIGIGFIAQVEKCNYPIPEDKLVPVTVVKQNIANFESKTSSKFKKVMYDYRSSEPTAKELVDFLKSHPEVTTVIRLNGVGKDSEGLGVDIEQFICKNNNVQFWYFPMGSFHKQKDWAETITKIMLKETVLVHCHHGYDRTGFIFAYKLIKYHGYSFEQVRKMNGWDKYDTYSKKFYPILRELDKKY